MYRAGCFRSNMAGDATREGKLFEQLLDSLLVPRDVWIELAVGALKVCIRDYSWSTVSWTRYVDHVQIVHLNQTIEMNVDKVEPRRRAPMTEQSGVYMFEI